MVTVKILGSGCANCRRLEAMVQKVVTAKRLDVRLEEVTDYAEIMKYPILSTPGLVIDEKLVSAGRIPAESEIVQWLSAAGAV